MTLPIQDSAAERKARDEREKLAIPIWQLAALRAGVIRSCVNCEQFDHKAEGCMLADNARPPATVIALSCVSWEQEIPF